MPEVDYLAIELPRDSSTIHDKHEVVVNGGMLIKEYGFQPGPAFGRDFQKLNMLLSMGSWPMKEPSLPISSKQKRRKMSDFYRR